MPRRQFFSRHLLGSETDLSDRRLLYEATILGDGPYAYYRLGESSGTLANDAVGSNHGTYVGSFTLGAASLITEVGNTSVDLDPTTRGRMEVPDLALTGTSWSLEFWVRSDDVTGDRRIFDCANTAGLRINGSNLEYFDSGGSGSWQVFGSPGFATGTTYHIVLSVTSDVMTAYLNGSALGATASTPFKILDNVLRMGDKHPSFGVSWDGRMDEISCWNVALTAGQASSHYNAGI